MTIDTPHHPHLPSLKPRVWVLLFVVAGFLALMTGVAVVNSGGAWTLAPQINPLYSLSGFIVGGLVGLTGVAGGSLMTPMLVLLFGFHPGAAVGTDLLFASGTKTVGTAVHGMNRTVDWKITGRLALGSIPAAVATLALLYVLGIRSESASRLITVTLGFALILTAICLVFRSRLLAFAAARWPAPDPAKTAWLTTVLGAVLGVLITLSSVGAGAIGVTVLVFLYPRMPIAKVVGSDIAHAVPLTLIAGLGHLWLGTVNVGVLGELLVGSVPGIIIGSYFAARVPDLMLRPILAAMLVVVGAKLTH
ncbi:MAG: sulfite exporter TauE/SafE family protein [Caulobacteraceae bacterium]